VKHIVLDSSVILRNPSVLFQKAKNIRLYVPASVFFELGRFNSPSSPEGDFRSLLTEAANGGYITFLSEIVGGSYPAQISVSKTDISFMIAAHELANKVADGEVYIASDDKDIINSATSIGAVPLTSQQLLILLENEASQITTESKDRADKLKKENIRYIIKNVVISAGVSLLANFSYEKINEIFGFVTKWGVLILVPILGVTLFWMRSKFRLSYGISEVIVGCIAAARVVFPVSKIQSFEAVVLIQFLGGLYIMVRGLDNIEKGLKGTRFLPSWQSIFGDS